jgi:hypothetical protein
MEKGHAYQKAIKSKGERATKVYDWWVTVTERQAGG